MEGATTVTPEDTVRETRRLAEESAVFGWTEIEVNGTRYVRPRHIEALDRRYEEIGRATLAALDALVARVKEAEAARDELAARLAEAERLAATREQQIAMVKRHMGERCEHLTGRAVAAEARVAALQETLRKIEQTAQWYADNDSRLDHEVDHCLCVEIPALARDALAATDRPEGTCSWCDLHGSCDPPNCPKRADRPEGTPQETGFAGTPPHLQPNGGTCTCTVVMLDGQRMNPNRSRCPIHGGTTPQEGNA